MPKDKISYNEVLDIETLIRDGDRIWLGVEVESNSNAEWTPKRMNMTAMIAKVIEQVPPPEHDDEELGELFYPRYENPAGYLTTIPVVRIGLVSDTLVASQSPVPYIGDLRIELKPIISPGTFNVVNVNQYGQVIAGSYVNIIQPHNINLINGLNWNTSTFTGKLGGTLIEHTTIVTQGFDFTVTGSGGIRHVSTNGNTTSSAYLNPLGYVFLHSASSGYDTYMNLNNDNAILGASTFSYTATVTANKYGILQLKSDIITGMYHSILVYPGEIDFRKNDESDLNINMLGLPVGSTEDSIVVVGADGYVRTISMDDIIVDSGAVITADNALHINPANNVQLGGTLLYDTTIDGYKNLHFDELKEFRSIVGHTVGQYTTIDQTNLNVISLWSNNTSNGDYAYMSVYTTNGGSGANVYLSANSGGSTHELTVNHNSVVVGNLFYDLNLYFDRLPSTTTAYTIYYNPSTYKVTYGLAPAGGDGGFLTADNGLNANTSTNVRLGGTLLQDTTINATSAYTLYVSGGRSGGQVLDITNSSSAGRAAYFHGQSGVGITVDSTGTQNTFETAGINGVALIAYTTGSAFAGVFRRSTVGTPDVIQIATQAGTAVGNGPAMSFYANTTAGGEAQGRIKFKWTDNATATKTSQYVIEGINNGTMADLFTLSGNGSTKLNKYGIGTFVNTPAYALGVDTVGNIVEFTVGSGGSTYTVNNGLSASTSTNFQLGGSSAPGAALLHHTYIDTTANYTLYITGSRDFSNPVLKIDNTSTFGSGVIANVDIGVALQGIAIGGYGVFGLSTNGPGGYFASTSISGIQAETQTNVSGAGQFIVNGSTTNAVRNIITLQLTSSGTVANGLGSAIQFVLESDNANNRTTHQIISKWTNVADASRSAQFELWGVNNVTFARRLAVASNGMLTLDAYSTSVSSGSPVYNLAVDASGNVITTSGAIGGGFVTADNGLTASSSTNVQLGGTLLHDTSISTASYKLLISGTLDGSAAPMVEINNATVLGGIALKVVNASPFQAAIFASGNAYGVSSSGYTGIYTVGTSIGLQTESNTDGGIALVVGISQSSTNNIQSIARFVRQTSATAANGIGGSLDFYNQVITGGAVLSNQLISKWSNATFSTRTSQFVINGVNVGVSADLITVHGSGSTALNKYGVGTFLQTPAYALGVNSSGSIVEFAVGGGGLGSITADNGLTANTSSNVRLGGTLLQNTTIQTVGYNFMMQGSSGATFIWNDGSVDIQNTANVITFSAVTTSGIAGVFDVNPSSTNTIVNSVAIRRYSSGTPAAGMGVGLQFVLQNTGSSSVNSNQIVSKWINPAAGSETTQLMIRGIYNAVSADVAVFDGTGVVGIGRTSSFGATRLDIVDDTLAGATMVNISSASISATGNAQKAMNVSLTGTNTNANQVSIALYVSNTHTGSGATNYAIEAIISGNGYAIYGEGGSAGSGIGGNADNGIGGYFTSSTSTGLAASSATGRAFEAFVTPSAANNVISIAALYRNTSGTPADGLGGALDFFGKVSSGSYQISNQIISKWTTINSGTRVSQIEIWGVNNTVLARKMLIDGPGNLLLDSGDFEAVTIGKGYVVKSPDGTRWRITVANGGGSVTITAA